ncbi:MAG: glycosyltransferase [Peptostreptococcaceae bacterium]|nr:glycosyltransferase [Peptostreptococcaceae bacterium]
MIILNLSTYPPQQCGIATFSMDLRKSLLLQDCKFEVLAISDVEDNEYNYPSEVVLTLFINCKADYIKAAEYANSRTDVELIVVQHEFGIFGGTDGEYILEFVSRLKKPFVIITHTVLPHPTEYQHQILSELGRQSSGVVCMTYKSAQLLIEGYSIPSSLVNVINHGVPLFKRYPQEILKQKYGFQSHQLIITFGLIGPGKGLEIGIHALANVVLTHPSARYLIIGKTHPVLKKREGEKYRYMLMDLVKELHLEDNVLFIDKFLSDEELGEYLYMTDVYLSPYPNRDQAVSGTMAFALGCGCAIVSTSYAYALEILKGGRGLLAQTNEPHELAALINKILDNPQLQELLQKKAFLFGEKITWPNIGLDYKHLFFHILHPLQDSDRREI